MAKVRLVGQEIYRGWDGPVEFVLYEGEEREVSAEKAAQLVSDFPHDFDVDGKKAKKPSKKEEDEAEAAAEAAVEEAGSLPPGDDYRAPEEPEEPKKSPRAATRRG